LKDVFEDIVLRDIRVRPPTTRIARKKRNKSNSDISGSLLFGVEAGIELLLYYVQSRC
jgi:hypothetical protein